MVSEACTGAGGYWLSGRVCSYVKSTQTTIAAVRRKPPTLEHTGAAENDRVCPWKPSCPDSELECFLQPHAVSIDWSPEAAQDKLLDGAE